MKISAWEYIVISKTKITNKKLSSKNYTAHWQIASPVVSVLSLQVEPSEQVG